MLRVHSAGLTFNAFTALYFLFIFSLILKDGSWTSRILFDIKKIIYFASMHADVQELLHPTHVHNIFILDNNINRTLELNRVLDCT